MRDPRAALAAWCLATAAACCATIAACSSTRTATGPLANKQLGVGLELQRWFVPIDPEARRDGLAIVVTQEADAETARARCDALWAALDEGGLTGVRFDALPAAGGGVFFDIRRF